MAIGSAALFLVAGSDGQPSADSRLSVQEEHALEELAALDAQLNELRGAHEQSSGEALQRPIAKWMQQRAGRLEALNTILAGYAEREERKIAQLPFSPMQIAPDATPRERHLLEELDGVQQAIGDLRRAHSESSPRQLQALIERWREANAELLDGHLQATRELSAENARGTEPPELVVEIPADASPEERKFLHERAAIAGELAELEARYQGATDIARQRAIARWQEENAVRLTAHLTDAKRFSAP